MDTETQSTIPTTAPDGAVAPEGIDYWQVLLDCRVVSPRRHREDLFLWRRGSAQLVLRINRDLSNFTIYSVLVSGTEPSMRLFRYVMHYNLLQRRETLTLTQDSQGRLMVVQKYTMELDCLTPPMLQRQILALQEAADRVDTELANTFGGELHFEDWTRLNQDQVDDLLDNLFD